MFFRRYAVIENRRPPQNRQPSSTVIYLLSTPSNRQSLPPQEFQNTLQSKKTLKSKSLHLEGLHMFFSKIFCLASFGIVGLALRKALWKSSYHKVLEKQLQQHDFQPQNSKSLGRWTKNLLRLGVFIGLVVSLKIFLSMNASIISRRRENLATMCDERARMLQDQFNVSMNHVHALAILISTFHHGKNLYAIDQLFSITTSECMDLLDQFFAMNPDSNGRVKIHGFLRIYGLGYCRLSNKIFRYLDVEKKGSITFRQFLLGSAHVRKQPSFWNACETAFNKCISDCGPADHVSLNQLGDIIRSRMPNTDDETVHRLFHLFDVDDDGVISRDDFMMCLRRNPLLVAIFAAPVWMKSQFGVYQSGFC